MQPGKELLISIIKPALDDINNKTINPQQLSFDNTALNTFMENFNLPEDILNLEESLLNSLIVNLEPKEARKEFLSNIKFIIGLAEISKKEETKLNLDKNQLLKLEELKELVRVTIERNNFNIGYIKDNKNRKISKYRQILKKVQNDEMFTDEDYDFIEEIVRFESKQNVESNLDRIFTYLNEFNARKLSEIYTGIKEEKEPEKEEVKEPIEDEKPKVSLELTPVIPKEEQPIIIEQVVEDYTPENPIDELEVTSLELEDYEPMEDIFSFVNLQKRKTTTKLVDAEQSQKIKEILAYLGFNYDEVSIEVKNSLTFEDIEGVQKFARFLKEENKVILSKIKNDNIYSLLYLLKYSSKERVNLILSVLRNFYQIGSAGGELFKIVNTATMIFGEDGSQQFAENSQLFKKYGVNIKELIDNNVNFLYTNNERLIKNIELLKEYDIDIALLIEKCSIALDSQFLFMSYPNLLVKNLKVLVEYGFDLRSFFKEKNSCYTILNSNNLEAKLDQLIEVGLNEYIHANENIAGNTLKTLIIKRIYYAYKNQMDVWHAIKTEYNRLSTNPLNEDKPKLTYQEFMLQKKYISQSEKLLTEADINVIKSDYQIMQLVDEANRPAIYSNNKLALLKRKTELIFGTQIISRPKLFRVFKTLINDGLEEKEALLYALVHNSILLDDEYLFIKDAVSRIGVDNIDVGLSKAV